MLRYRPDNVILQMLSKACDIVLATLLWGVCCAPILTIGAATAALSTVMWRIAGGHDVRVLREFWHSFKANWKVSTIVWTIMMGLGLILAGNIYICWGVQGEVNFILLMRASVVMFATLYFVSLLYVFGGIAKFHVTVGQALKNALWWGLHGWQWSILLVAISLFNIVLIVLLEWFSIILVAYNLFFQNKILRYVFSKCYESKSFEAANNE